MAVACALGTGIGGCFRHTVEPQPYMGSLKDDLVDVRPAAVKPVAVKPAPPAKALRPAVTAPEKNDQTAVQPPAPGGATDAPRASSAPSPSVPPPPSAVGTPEAGRSAAGTTGGPPDAAPPPVAKPKQTAAAERSLPAPAKPTVVTAPTTAPPAAIVEDAAVAAKNLAEGQALFRVGKVAEARARFTAALPGMAAEASWALAQSFDTFYLSQLPSTNGAPDMQRALLLYERAVERGAKEAQVDLERVRATLAAAKP